MPAAQWLQRVLLPIVALAALSCAEPIPAALAEAVAQPDPEPQTYSGTFSGAFQVTETGSQGTPAVPAVCPAEHPTSCSSIGASGWCCGSGYTCGWNAGSVGCCPSGQTCNSYGAQTYTSQWQPSTTWQQQTTTYYQQQSSYYEPTSTVYVQGQATAVTVTQEPSYTSTQQYNHAGFCSTVYETGPNLPTQAQGQCGTILIAKAGASRSIAVNVGVVSTALAGGVLLFAWTCMN